MITNQRSTKFRGEGMYLLEISPERQEYHHATVSEITGLIDLRRDGVVWVSLSPAYFDQIVRGFYSDL